MTTRASNLSLGELVLVHEQRPYVMRGIKVLDKKRPHWRKLVYVAGLDLGDPFNCVLAQIYGEYHAGLDMIKPFWISLLPTWNQRTGALLKWSQKHGFTALTFACSAEWRALQVAWVKELANG